MQKSIDIMSEHLYNQLVRHVDNNDIESSDAIYQEWIVDGNDPEDGSYEFMFIDQLQSL